MWKRNCGYSVCEGVTSGLEAKAPVWLRNCGTSVAVYFLCVGGTTDLPSNIPFAEAEF